MAGRTTVLPRRRAAAAVVVEERPRFERVSLLGEGGMSQVELARDNDIRRTVALKRLRAQDPAAEALLRFADEVRIVGQLEHPSIVPIYDVGRDEAGQVYLVMKHLDGETMEQVIEKLRSRDPATVAQYSIEYRVHLFLGVLDAVRYAHARGIIHRDLKPSNVMIGRFGEVTVLDWGIAKPVARRDGSASARPLDETSVATHDSRLQETQLGSLAGTPLYMSPEQAAGRNDDLDERSDVYSLCLLLYEWLSLLHPLRDGKTVTEVLSATIAGLDLHKVGERAVFAGVPAEWVQVIVKGLVKDRDQRIPSVTDLESRIRAVLDGRVRVECHVTLTKRVAHTLLRWIDRHPVAYAILFYGTIASAAGALLWGGYRLVQVLV
jgi:serine/threonine-protein kinase